MVEAVYVRVCVLEVCVLSDLNTSDIVMGPGRNSWSAGEKSGGAIRREKRCEVVRYTDNGIRLKHSGVGESPFLCIVPSNTT